MAVQVDTAYTKVSMYTKSQNAAACFILKYPAVCLMLPHASRGCVQYGTLQALNPHHATPAVEISNSKRYGSAAQEKLGWNIHIVAAGSLPTTGGNDKYSRGTSHLVLYHVAHPPHGHEVRLR